VFGQGLNARFLRNLGDRPPVRRGTREVPASYLPLVPTKVSSGRLVSRDGRRRRRRFRRIFIHRALVGPPRGCAANAPEPSGTPDRRVECPSPRP
jgi:hypothetical protein